MKTIVYAKTIAVLSGAGTLFAGYLSGVKLFTDTCAFNESCPYFLGYPACWYGLAMFLAMFVAAVSLWRKPSAFARYAKFIGIVSVLGIVFSGRFVWQEVAFWLRAETDYALLLPTCVYGLIFYIAIGVITTLALRGNSRTM